LKSASEATLSNCSQII